jgi:hypothetical protein
MYFRGVAPVPQLRVVLLGVPPLLADLIEHVVATRLERRREGQRASGQPGADPLQIDFVTLSEADVSADIGALVSQPGPNVVIKWANPAMSTPALASAPNHVQVLTLSSDLTLIYGPGEQDSAAFTADALAETLYDIAMRI